MIPTSIVKSVNIRKAGMRSSAGRDPSNENNWVRDVVRPAESCAEQQQQQQK